MISIVSGFYRSGTSAMMQALIAGGMQASWSEDRNLIAQRYSDENYKPNPEGLFEVPLREYSGLNFPLQYQDRLIKVMLWGLDSFVVNPLGYRVVIMRRDPEEIRQSFEAFFQDRKCIPLDGYYERIERALSLMKNRRDVLNVRIIDYPEFVAHPQLVLESLQDDGWPINVEKAASVIDPQKYRFRLELLTPGI